MTVCVAPFRVLWYPDQGGHAWVYMNWCLGLQANGCNVIWLDSLRHGVSRTEAIRALRGLKAFFEEVGFRGRLALIQRQEDTELFADLKEELDQYAISWEEAADQSDIFLNFHYDLSANFVSRFKRTALMDIDPGLFQMWLNEGQIKIAPYDLYFSIGETVGAPDSGFPDLGFDWHYTPPVVYLPEWPICSASSHAPYSTISNWWSRWEKFGNEVFNNEKRTSFLQYVDLPSAVDADLELAIPLSEYDGEDRMRLEQGGWNVRHTQEVSSTPFQYRSYIQQSRGEFSCAKPSCMKFANAWISDRTLCYLASGKPAVVQHTGPSKFLPDGAGLFRFRNRAEAAQAIALIEAEYERHSLLASELAKEYFDASKVTARLLETALSINNDRRLI